MPCGEAAMDTGQLGPVQQACPHVRQKDEDVSMLIFFKRSIKFAATLRMVLLGDMPIHEWHSNIYIPLIEDCMCTAPKKKMTHQELTKINAKMA